MSLHFKPEVRFHPALAMAVALMVAKEVYAKYGADCWITSGNDGVHKEGSFHYLDRAVDLRTKTLGEEKHEIAAELKARLAPQFDVIFENVGKPGEHIHVEYDTK